MAKQRKSATETKALYVIGEVEDCDVLLVDDLTETAGTLTSAAEILKERGAQKIYAGVSHAVLVDIAIPRLQKSQIEELITTNSTPVRTVEGFKTTVLCVAELLGEGIKRIHNDESVSSLFKIDKANSEFSHGQTSKTQREPRAPALGRSAVRKIKAHGAVPAVIYGGERSNRKRCRFRGATSTPCSATLRAKTFSWNWKSTGEAEPPRARAGSAAFAARRRYFAYRFPRGLDG